MGLDENPLQPDPSAELMASIDREIDDYDRFLERAKEIADWVPIVQEMKEEAEARRVAVTNIPVDILAETAPKFLAIQTEGDRVRQQFLPVLPSVPKASYTVLPTGASSGSTATIYSTVLDLEAQGQIPLSSMKPISAAFGALAERKVRQQTLPGLIGRVNKDLYQMVTLAIQDIAKAKSGMIGTDQALIRLRDVIQELWSTMAANARKKCPEAARIQHLQLKKEAHRIVVAQCVVSADTRNVFTASLDDLHIMFKTLSSDGSKDMLNQDKVRMEAHYNSWILTMEALAKLLASQDDSA